MSNELQTTAATGATVTAKLVNAAGTVAATVTLTEGPTTLYRGSVPGGTAAGTYSVIISDGYSTALGSLVWDGTAEVLQASAPAIATAVLNATAGAGTVRDAATRLNALPEASPVLITPAAPTIDSMGRIYAYLRTPNGHRAVATKVTIMLEAPAGAVVTTPEGVVVSGRKVDLVTDDFGALSADLWRNDLLSPAGTTYSVTSAPLGTTGKKFTVTTAVADLGELLAP